MPTITLPGGRPVEVGDDQIGQGINSNLTGTVPGGYSPAYGGVPQIPNPIASQWQAIGGDINSLPSLFSLGNAYNLFNYDQRLGQVAGTPGFGSVLSNLGGNIPRDVADKVALQGAQRGISTGLTGSSNSDASLLRAMGLTSLDLQKLGQQQYGDLLGHFQGAAPFDISKFLVTPEDQQAANTAANVSAAAPNPQQAALEEFRKLMEAIQAGKANSAGAGGGGIPSIADLLNGLKNQSKPYVEPGNTVLNSTAGNPPPPRNDAIINAWRNQFANPNTTGRPDAITNAGNQGIFGSSMLGGLGTSNILNGLGFGNPLMNPGAGGGYNTFGNTYPLGGGGGGGNPVINDPSAQDYYSGGGGHSVEDLASYFGLSPEQMMELEQTSGGGGVGLPPEDDFWNMISGGGGGDFTVPDFGTDLQNSFTNMGNIFNSSQSDPYSQLADLEWW